MSNKPFLFKIAPVMVDDRETGLYFVQPALTGPGVYAADEDRAGIAQVRQDFDPQSVECEPELAAAAAEFQIGPGEITPQRAQLIGGMAFDMVLPDRFRSLESRSPLYVFAVSAGAFWQSAPWRYGTLARPIEVTFDGAVQDRMIAAIAGDADDQAFSLYPDLATLRVALEQAQQGRFEDTARLNKLVVTFESQPAFATDAMRRAYGLPRIPVPAKMWNGMGTPLQDADLLALASGLKAVSSFSDRQQSGTALIKSDDLEVTAVARLLEPLQIS